MASPCYSEGQDGLVQRKVGSRWPRRRANGVVIIVFHILLILFVTILLFDGLDPRGYWRNGCHRGKGVVLVRPRGR
jgi:hypothetical protein